MGRGLRCARDATQQGAADAGLRASARAGLQRGGDQRTPDTPHGYLGGLPIRKRSVRSATTPASLSPVQAHTDQGPRCARVPFAQQVWPEHRKRALNGDPPIPHRRRRADPPLRALRPAATSATIVRRRLPGERSCRRAPRPDAMGPVGLTLGITRLHASGCGVAETRCGDRFRADACPKGIPASIPPAPLLANGQGSGAGGAEDLLSGQLEYAASWRPARMAPVTGTGHRAGLVGRALPTLLTMTGHTERRFRFRDLSAAPAMAVRSIGPRTTMSLRLAIGH